MISLQSALANAKQQIEQLKDIKLKNQLLGYVNQAIAHQDEKESWKVKTYSGNALSQEEAISYEFEVDQLPDANSENYGKRFQLSVGIDKNGVFNFGYMLQGESASRKRSIDYLNALKSERGLKKIMNAKQIATLEEALYNNPIDYKFNGETVNVTFSPAGGLNSTIHKFQNGYDMRNGNEYRKWLGFAVLNEPAKVLSTSHSITTIIATDENYNNKLVTETKKESGQLMVEKTETRRVERVSDNEIAYSIKNTESANGTTKVVADKSYKGKIPANNIAQIDFDMIKYCNLAEGKSTENLSK